MTTPVQRKLTTILAADAEGYSRAMEADEIRALGDLRSARSVFSKFIDRYHGRIANTAGDGLIAEFPSVVEAVQCAIEVQNELGQRAGTQNNLNFRIGIHLGDVLVDGQDLLGEGVNLAARLQTMAEPGGILISRQVYDHVNSKLSVGFDYLGEKRPKNYANDVAVYRVSLGHLQPGPAMRFLGLSTAAWQSMAQENRLRRGQLIRLARIFGILWVMLLGVDLVTGPPFWAYWPGAVMAVIVGLRAAPLFCGSIKDVRFVRALVLIAALAFINIVNWPGFPWVIWPAAGLLLWRLYRRSRLHAD
jgi:adenylate cyclase